MEYKILITGLAICSLTNPPVLAATPIDLHQKPVSYLVNYLPSASGVVTNQSQVKETSHTVDFNQTKHVRLQQVYKDIPVWHATAVLHAPVQAALNNGLVTTDSPIAMNGTLYEGIEKDLANVPSSNTNAARQAMALQTAKQYFLQNHNGATISQESVQTIIFVDDQHNAHYGFLTKLYSDDGKTGPHRPASLVDAATLKIYKTWDEVKHIDSQWQTVVAGGIGGNQKIIPTTGQMAKLYYDNGTEVGHLPALTMQKIALPDSTQVCFLQNNDVVVFDASYQNIASGLCPSMPSLASNLPWLDVDEDGTHWYQDEVNGAFSPSLDALYTATVVKKFYQDWYKTPVLTNPNGSPMQLIMRVHYGRNYANAHWDGETMTFGDGDTFIYPLVTVDITAHEISHGFTQQHADLDQTLLQMNGLNESFSDMASAAIEYYLTNNNTWQIGASVIKGPGAIRYLNEPTRDGYSIDNFKNYDPNMNEHDLAGIFNKAFYLIATAPGWDTHKAFNIMVSANMNYWTSSMQTLPEAACGVIEATKGLHYNHTAVKNAFNQVGVTTKGC